MLKKFQAQCFVDVHDLTGGKLPTDLHFTLCSQLRDGFMETLIWRHEMLDICFQWGQSMFRPLGSGTDGDSMRLGNNFFPPKMPLLVVKEPQHRLVQT